MGKVVLFELNSQDPERAAAFYSSVFGWKIAEPNWGYYPVTTGDAQALGIHGGISKGPQDFPHGTRIQIEVDNIEETIQQCVEQGAQILRDTMEFDDFYLAYLVDPVGIGIGLIQYKK
ncbi:VOC family protein [Paenibacillus sp. 1001270B_150601_E10]|uniref:VOC family protein n=1 Tax=Paenibacillus sp. 1001270B_150601_E10 TaxID=2787079 RepID=UPI00189FB190|nr:VOC family protein [Paenibacillus sp. 1001270B_150601_E10]